MLEGKWQCFSAIVTVLKRMTSFQTKECKQIIMTISGRQVAAVAHPGARTSRDEEEKQDGGKQENTAWLCMASGNLKALLVENIKIQR